MKHEFRTLPKVRTGGVLEDSSAGDGPSSTKKPRIDLELKNGKGGQENKASFNVVLNEEDEKVRMVSSFLGRMSILH